MLGLIYHCMSVEFKTSGKFCTSSLLNSTNVFKKCYLNYKLEMAFLCLTAIVQLGVSDDIAEAIESMYTA